MPGRITISDVAREAGVSMMTVSRVLNNKAGVGQETRQTILDIIKKLGYRPSSVARGLATQRTGTIGLVMPDVSNPFFPGIALGVEKVAFAEGYSVLLCNTGEDSQREMDVLELLAEKWVDGLVLCSSRLDEEKLTAILPLYPAAVLINRQLINPEDPLAVGSVLIADKTGGQMATRHLLSRGHKKIGYIAGPGKSQSNQGRLEGYKSALAEAGLPAVSEYVHSCSPTVEGGFQAGCNFLVAHPEVTALFCYNDLIAVGVLQACTKLGRKVPTDLSVVGFDDIILAPLVTPSLTTCRVVSEELGELAARLLLDRIGGCSVDCEKKILQPELIIRASAP
jgi:LacI family transcriptional regulator